MRKGQKMTDVQKAKRRLRAAILDWYCEVKGRRAAKAWVEIELAISNLETKVAIQVNMGGGL